MTAIGAVAGTKLYIGTAEAIASPDEWKEITNISNIGDVGTAFSKIAIESVGDGYTRQIKGTQSAPTFSLVINRNDEDPGQMALKAAGADRNSLYNFKLVENDIDGGNFATTTVWQGRAYGFTSTYGTVSSVKQVKCDIEIEPDTIVVTEAS